MSLGSVWISKVPAGSFPEKLAPAEIKVNDKLNGAKGAPVSAGQHLITLRQEVRA